MKLWINGKLSAQSNAQQGVIAYPDKIFFDIGCWHDEDAFYVVDGYLERVAIYNELLTEKRDNKQCS